jgi:integrase
MKATKFKPRNCWRVQVPARYNGGKRKAEYFDTKADADRHIAKLTNRPDTGRQAKMEVSDQVFFEQLLATLGNKETIQAAVYHYRDTILSVKKTGTVAEMCTEYLAWKKAQGHKVRTLRGDRYHIGKFAKTFGTLKPVELTGAKIDDWVQIFKAGSSQRCNMWRSAHALLEWGRTKEWIGFDPMAKLDEHKPKKPVGKNIVRNMDDFERLLRAAAGLDPFPPLPAGFNPNFKVVEDYSELLPVLVLQAFAGMRTRELVRSTREEEVLDWSDINLGRGLIRVRHGVAKATGRENDERWITMDDAVRAWLAPIAKTAGPVFSSYSARWFELRYQLMARLGVKIGHNALRHSYATYSVSFRGTAETAKNMGDLESTARRNYMDMSIEPETGRAWFAMRPDASAKVVQMQEAA